MYGFLRWKLILINNFYYKYNRNICLIIIFVFGVESVLRNYKINIRVNEKLCL